MENQRIKNIYSDETIAILNEKHFKEKLKLCHEARNKLGLKKKNKSIAENLYVCELALGVYLYSLSHRLEHKKRELSETDKNTLKLVRQLRKAYATDKELFSCKLVLKFGSD